MHHSIIRGAAVALLALFFACKNEKAPETVKTVTVGAVTFKKSEGRDCAKMDSVHNQCAEINLAWPEVKDGSAPLKTSVATWSKRFLVGLLSPESGDSAATNITVEAAADSFLQAHREWSKEAPGSPLGEWVVESSDTVLLNDGVRLTLEIDAYTFTGGAHGLPLSAVTTFDVATGKPLSWTDLVTDTVQMKALAEKKFREARADLFKSEKEGGSEFNFDETFPFKLADNYGLTDKGIYFNYIPYEVTPYAFGNTEFVIPFEVLGSLSKIKK